MMIVTLQTGRDGRVIARHPDTGKICFPDRTGVVGETWEAAVTRDMDRACNIRLIRRVEWTWRIDGLRFLATEPGGREAEYVRPSACYGLPADILAQATAAWRVAEDAVRAATTDWRPWFAFLRTHPSFAIVAMRQSAAHGQIQETKVLLDLAGLSATDMIRTMLTAGWTPADEERSSREQVRMIDPSGTMSVLMHVPRGPMTGARIREDQVMLLTYTDVLGHTQDEERRLYDSDGPHREWWTLLSEADQELASRIIAGDAHEEACRRATRAAAAVRERIERMARVAGLLDAIAADPRGVTLRVRTHSGGQYESDDGMGMRSFPDTYSTTIGVAGIAMSVPGHIHDLYQAVQALEELRG